jgi:hypothetical protein
MKIKEVLVILLLAFLGAPILNSVIYSVAFAHGHGGVDPLQVIAAVDPGLNWNPLTWPWPEIIATLISVLGVLIAALRPVAAFTKWTGDNKILHWLETILEFVMRVFVPAKMLNGKSLGGGKAPGPGAADYQRGGKNGEDA